jgi:hypothetical protein
MYLIRFSLTINGNRDDVQTDHQREVSFQACHARIASKGARLGLPQLQLGIIPGLGGTVITIRKFIIALLKSM